MPINYLLRMEVMMSDDFTCVYCGYRGPDVQVDHFIPSSLGGPDIIANLYACCGPCNVKKGTRQIHEVGMSLLYGRFNPSDHSAEPRIPDRNMRDFNINNSLRHLDWDGMRSACDRGDYDWLEENFQLSELQLCELLGQIRHRDGRYKDENFICDMIMGNKRNTISPGGMRRREVLSAIQSVRQGNSPQAAPPPDVLEAVQN